MGSQEGAAVAGRILVIDDTPENVKLLITLLNDRGYEARGATSGEMALAALKSWVPELILLDILMPKMNGYEVCSKIKENPQYKEIPVIFISALSSADDKVSAFERGGVDYIPKPFKEAEVLARVSVHLELYRLKKQLREDNEDLEEHVRWRTAELVASNQALEKAMRAKSDFLSMMSHEFRTPLNGILGMSTLLKGMVPKDQVEDVGLIEESGQYLLKLVDNLLNLTNEGLNPKKQVGLLKLDASDIEVLCRNALSEIEFQAKKKSIETCLDINDLVDSQICVDSACLGQILSNLLDNAIKFSPSHSRVTLKVFESNKRVYFQVLDQGVLISPEDRSRIFEPFVQLEPVRTRSHGGAGLGLALVKQLTDSYGGTVEVEESPEGGNLFQVSWPCSIT